MSDHLPIDQQESDWVALGRIAVTCTWWRWMAGMLLFGFEEGQPDDWVRCQDNLNGDTHERYAKELAGDPLVEWLPDFRDAATLGWLLHLVRSAWGCDSIHVTPPARARGHKFSPDEWVVWLPQTYPTLNSVIGRGPTEASALVAALKARNN